MNRRFRLAALERLRAGALADAARALGAARRDLAAALAHRDEVRRELNRTRVTGPAAPVEHESAAARRHRLREDLARAGERCSAAHGQELAALAAWNSARSDLRAVEALHERHRLALAEQDARTEQREIDEFAAQTHQRDRDGEPT